MPLGAHRFVSNDARTTILRIYSYEDKNLQGTIFNVYYGWEIPFYNLIRMLQLIEGLLNQLDCPQASTQNRSFRTNQRDGQADEQSILPQCEESWQGRMPLATFKLNILFRQGASWQGRLSWTETKQEESFRSVLELIKLIDSALPQQAVVSSAVSIPREKII